MFLRQAAASSSVKDKKFAMHDSKVMWLDEVRGDQDPRDLAFWLAPKLSWGLLG